MNLDDINISASKNRESLGLASRKAEAASDNKMKFRRFKFVYHQTN